MTNEAPPLPGWEPSPERLVFQNRRRAATHAAFLLPHLREDSRILDCGCGEGSITNDFAAIAVAGFVIGIDLDDARLRNGRRAAREGKLTNVFYEQQDVRELEFADAAFDVVFAHALLDHIADAALAIVNMARVLRPGGVLVLRSADWTRFRTDPHLPDAMNAVDQYQDMMWARDGNPSVGEQFAPMLQAAGLEHVRLSCAVEIHDPPTALARAMCKVLADRARPGGDAEEASRRRVLQSFRNWAHLPGAKVVESWHEALATKL